MHVKDNFCFNRSENCLGQQRSYSDLLNVVVDKPNPFIEIIARPHHKHHPNKSHSAEQKITASFIEINFHSDANKSDNVDKLYQLTTNFVATKTTTPSTTTTVKTTTTTKLTTKLTTIPTTTTRRPNDTFSLYDNDKGRDFPKSFFLLPCSDLWFICVDKTDCGVRPLRPTARVVGGRNAHFGEWPWQGERID